MHTQQQHFFARRLGLILLIANVIGAIIYLVRTSLSWAIPQEHGLVPIMGKPFIWFAGIVPVVIVFFPLNLIWGHTFSSAESGKTVTFGCRAPRYGLLPYGLISRITEDESKAVYRMYPPNDQRRTTSNES
jgi:hypothetical protein